MKSFPESMKAVNFQFNPVMIKMEPIELVGHFGALLSSITFIPQVYRAWKTKSVDDLSLTMMFIVFSSTVVWLVYAVNLNLWPVITANSIICVLSMILIYFKFTFKTAEERA